MGFDLKRFGRQTRSNTFPYHVRHASASDESAPTTLGQFIQTTQGYSHIQFMIRLPAWVTSYQVSFHRYIDGQTDFISRFETTNPIAENTAELVIETQGQPIALQLHDIVTNAAADADDPFVITFACLNP